MREISEVEIWKPVVGFEGRYEISSHGRVRAMFIGNNGGYKPGRILKQELTKTGYLKVTLYNTDTVPSYRRVHALVLESFISLRPEGNVARHLDGVRTHNVVSNLKWGTQKQNAKDAKDHGTWLHGERCRLAKLTEKEVVEIRSMYDGGILHAVIANQFGIAKPTVSQIGCRKSWRHIP